MSSSSASGSRSLRSPLGHARGLGSAKEGLHHWWMQRLTAIALLIGSRHQNADCVVRKRLADDARNFRRH